MHILAVTTHYYPELQFGGPPLRIHTLNSALVHAGHTVEVITFHSQQPQGGESVNIHGVQVHYLRWFGRGNFQVPAAISQIHSLIKRADVVHIYGLYTLLGPLIALYAKRMCRPYLLEPLGMYIPRARNYLLKRVYHQLFTQWIARDAARIVASSETEAQELRGLGSPHNLHVRSHLFDFKNYQTLPDSSRFRTTHNITQDEKLVIFIGRISPIKNLDTLIRAFSQANIPHAQLLLIGPQSEPEYTERLQRLIAELDLSSQVSLLGPLYNDDKLAALSAADLFVLPSLSESFGNAAAEAVAAQVPVLLTNTCGVAPLIHNRAGLAVEPNVQAIASGLQTLLLEHEQRERLMAQRNQVMEELTTSAPLTQMEQIYQQLLTEWLQLKCSA